LILWNKNIFHLKTTTIKIIILFTFIRILNSSIVNIITIIIIIIITIITIIAIIIIIIVIIAIIITIITIIIITVPFKTEFVDKFPMNLFMSLFLPRKFLMLFLKRMIMEFYLSCFQYLDHLHFLLIKK